MPDHRDRDALATQYALKIWPTLDKNQQAGIRFGLFPADVMRQAETETGCDGRTLAIAFMDAAKANGGMRA